jgi:hypothetical protein
MRGILAVFLLVGLMYPVQALDIPGCSRKKEEAQENKANDDSPSEQAINDTPAGKGGKDAKEGKAEAPFPVRVTNEDINGSNPKFLETYFVAQSFMQKMQLPDGSLTPEPGRVLIFQKGDTFIVAFYRPLDGAYVLMGQPVGLKDVIVPREDFDQVHNVPAIVAKRSDGQGMWRIALLMGKVVNEPAQDDTVGKSASSAQPVAAPKSR